jgi:hypothetical protein
MAVILLTVENVVEILLSFPLVIKQSVGSVMSGKFSNTFPPIGFPFDDAANSVKLSDAIATVLRLTVSFKLGKIGTFLMAFNGASHGFCLVETMVRNEGAVSSPQLLFFTKLVPLGQWQNQGSVPGNERELHLLKK